MATDNSLYGTYLGHSGFLIEHPEGALIFDWHEGQLPQLLRDTPIYMFISHIHEDHVSQKALDFVRRPEVSQLFLGYDKSSAKFNARIASYPDNVREKIIYLDGMQSLRSDDGKLTVSTLKSNDLGVAFLVDIGGMKIFHAGDLAFYCLSKEEFQKFCTDLRKQGYLGSIEKYGNFRKRYLADFVQMLEPIKGKTVDYGMIPLDPRFPDEGPLTVESYLKTAHFRLWSPMHLWGNYTSVATYAKSHPKEASTMIGTTGMVPCHSSINVGSRYFISPTLGSMNSHTLATDRSTIEGKASRSGSSATISDLKPNPKPASVPGPESASKPVSKSQTVTQGSASVYESGKVVTDEGIVIRTFSDTLRMSSIPNDGRHVWAMISMKYTDEPNPHQFPRFAWKRVVDGKVAFSLRDRGDGDHRILIAFAPRREAYPDYSFKHVYGIRITVDNILRFPIQLR